MVNQSEMSIFQHLSLDVDNQKQIKFWNKKTWQMFNGSLNSLHFFYSSCTLGVIFNKFAVFSLRTLKYPFQSIKYSRESFVY